MKKAAKQKIDAVIVVEGRDDTRRLKEFFDVETIESQGSTLSQETLTLIAAVAESREVIVLTDPDWQGNHIRQRIQEAVPAVRHAFIAKAEAKPHKPGASLGVEHASKIVLEQALASAYGPVAQALEERTKIKRQILAELGLVDHPKAKEKRSLLGEYLRIGYTNGKQLQNRLAMFGIDEDALRTAIQVIDERGEQDDA